MCEDLIRSLPDMMGWIVAWCVLAPVTSAILMAVWYELRHARGIAWQHELDHKIYNMDAREK